MNNVSIWKEKVIFPYYEIGQPEKLPIFAEKRVYQGSSGAVYPYPITEKIKDTKISKEFIGLFLENRYLKIMVLPELGGRVHMAFDKIRNRHFIYYNQVIKPALVGLLGPWICGGIEFNWPQHHRPSTFLPIDYELIENSDGSKTIWVHEIERMTRTEGSIGYTLYPDKAYLEVQGKIYNRTPFPQTFLWWANPAVKATEYYQSIFPPDVTAVYDHGKRDVSDFPIATGKYYKVDYSPGTDISFYKNIPVPTSFMAVDSKYDFLGGYEHDIQAGILHVADRHISPGKKQWTWGTDDFGQAWIKNLTDEDGPYIEIMVGVFTDNQPDFSWIKPYEEKSFKQYFFPYSSIDIVKNASKDIVLSAELKENDIVLKIYTTSVFNKLNVKILYDEKLIFKKEFYSSPENPINEIITHNINNFEKSKLKILITKENDFTLLEYNFKDEIKNIEKPEPAKAAKDPEEIESNELLYLTGLHIEQYRHATYSPESYYLEALKRDPEDIRNNNALGLFLLRRGQFKKAENHFKKAIKRLTIYNNNPYDGECYYNLAWALMLQDKYDEAYDNFYKSIWDDNFQHAGYLNLARITIRKKDFPKALEFIEKSLSKNSNSHSARHLKAIILRKLNKIEEALKFIEESLNADHFNFGCLFEKMFILKDLNNNKEFYNTKNYLLSIIRDDANNFLEIATDYIHSGLYEEAIEILELHIENKTHGYPLIYYYLGYCHSKLLNHNEAISFFNKAHEMPEDYCFPNKIEDILVLEEAIKINDKDYKALYYLGNLWYDKKQYAKAIECWEKSIELNYNFAITHRNLAIAYYNKLKDPVRAVNEMEIAFSINKSSRILMELDQLYKITNKSIDFRLANLNKYDDLVKMRDDLTLEKVTLLNLNNQYDEALEILLERKFHPWEGGEGKVVKQYLISLIEKAKIHILNKNYSEALNLLLRTDKYPDNLGEGKLSTVYENDIYFLKGVCYENLKDFSKAEEFYNKATQGNIEPVQAIFYNDPQPDMIFYQGLAWEKLGNKEFAKEIFIKLIDFGRNHINDNVKIDYFAVSLPDLLVFDQDLNFKNKIHCNYMIGLGFLGLKNFDISDKYFYYTIELDNNHQGARIHLKMKDVIKHIFLL